MAKSARAAVGRKKKTASKGRAPAKGSPRRAAPAPKRSTAGAMRAAKRAGASASKTASGTRSARRGADPYARLTAELRRIAVLSSVGSTISWDQETMMPAKGGALRSDQRQMLAGMVHEERTSKRLGDLIRASEAQAKRHADERRLANLRELRRDYDKATKLPTSLVSEMARCASLGMEAWKEARQKSDFARFLPWLQKTIDLNRRKAECYGRPKGGREHYDALLDEYEPGMTAARTESIFTPLRARLVPLIDGVAGAGRRPDQRPARAATPIEQQKRFVRFVSERIGFDFEAGRIDESTHPFCDGMGPGDTRMTNRYRPDGWADALGTAMHEGGHAMYEQGLPKHELFGQPLAEAVSLGIHESQSRLWENLVGRSRGFWRWATPEARRLFSPSLDAFGPEEIYKAVNIIEPGLIRVESDELTYNLHIMLRFDLERAMIRGDLTCRDLPGVWNERISGDLGLSVPDDRRGCLQDVHWSMGAVGYFPTYTFGNLYSAQLWEAMARDLPGREELLARGEFTPILNWLRDKIHRHGRQFQAEDLCRRVTGLPLSSDPLLRHLENKVRAVYS